MTTPIPKEKSEKEYEWICTQIMFRLRNEFKEFTADEFASFCRAETVPPRYIKKFSGCMFRQFASQGYIKKTNRFRLSSRNGSSPLPIWEGLAK